MTRPKPKPVQAGPEMLAPDFTRSTMTGHCAFPSPGSHGFCHEQFVLTGRKACLCPCHDEDPAPSAEGFGGKALNGTRLVRSALPVKNDMTEHDRILEFLDKAEEVGTAVATPNHTADGRPTGRLIR